MKSPGKGRLKALYPYFVIALGTAISTFGIRNIHSRTHITEGGVLGMVLLLNYWLKISPSIVTLILDGICYAMGFKYLGGKFLKLSLFATCSVSFFYWFYALFPYALPDLSGNPLLASILGGLFIGVGIGLVVRTGAAAGGDDALALIISHLTKCPISRAYLATDLIVLVLSLSYIPFGKIIFSLITVTVSSLVIGVVDNLGKQKPKEIKNIAEQAV